MTTEGFNENLSVSSDGYDQGERQMAFPGEAAAVLQAVEPQQMAQAEVQQGAETAAQPGVQTVVAEGNVVKLPAGTSIEKVEVDGNNLVLVQPDGSRIVIENAALRVPTFVIDDVEIPREALVAALEASNINVAAGPDGTIAATAPSSGSSGGNFSATVGDIGEAGPAIDLLDSTSLQFAALDEETVQQDAANPGGSTGGTPGGPTNRAGSILVESHTVLEAELRGGSATVSEKPLPLVEGGEESAGDPAPVTVTGAFTVSDPDGLADIAGLTINGGPSHALDALVGLKIEGRYGELTILGFDPATGRVSYSYELTKPYDNSLAGPDADQGEEVFTLTITDRGGLSASADLRITILDDAPMAPGKASELPVLEVFGSDDSVAAAQFFKSFVFGADGEHKDTPVSYALKLLAAGTEQGGIRTGLFAVDVEGGQGREILLSQDPITGEIRGQADSDGPAYFTITLENGQIKLNQNEGLAIWHENGGESDDVARLVISGGSLTLTATLMDGDGDKASSPVDLGNGVFTFRDGEPKLEATLAEGFRLWHDETPSWQTATADDVAGWQNLIKGLPFLPVLFNERGLPFGLAQSDKAAVELVKEEYGADKQGAPASYRLVVEDGTDSGRTTTAGDPIKLYNETIGGFDYVIGRTEKGAVAFALHLGEDGKVTMAQWLAIKSNDPNAPDELDLLKAETVFIEVTITDGDGDKTSARVDISRGIGFLDDAPDARDTSGLWALDDENVNDLGRNGGPGDAAIAGKTLVGLLDFNAGRDGLQKIVVSADVSSLQAIWIDADGVGHPKDVKVEWIPDADGPGGKLVGMSTDGVLKVFTLTVDRNGGYKLDMHAPLVHSVTSGSGSPTAWEDNIDLEFTYTVTDGDNDTDSAKLTVTVDDDSPQARNAVDGSLNEGGIANSTAVAAIGLSKTVHFGADGQNAQGAFRFAEVNVKTAITSDGEKVWIKTEGGKLVGYAANTNATVFTVEIKNGEAVFTLLRPLDYNGQKSLTLNVGPYILAVDGDGDAVKVADVKVVIVPPAPTVTSPEADSVEEAGLQIGTGGDAATGQQTVEFLSKGGVQQIKLGDHVLKTSPETFPEEMVNGVKGQLTAWYEYNAATGKGKIHYNFTLTGKTSGDDTAASFDILVKDKAGQSSQATELVIKVIDDAPLSPEAAETRPEVVVDETVLSTNASIAAANFFKGFVFGADGASQAASPSYALILTGTNVRSGLFALDANRPEGKGKEILLSQQQDGSIVGKIGSTVYFTIKLENGQIKLDQQKVLWHDDEDNADDAAKLNIASGSLKLSVTITDGDGDSKSGFVELGKGVFVFKDDGPTLTLTPDSTFRVVHDESFGWQTSGADDVAGILPNAALSLLFMPLSLQAGLPFGLARGDKPAVTVGANYGADGKGAPVSYELEVKNAASGLKTTAGEDITLSSEEVGGIDYVVGRTSSGDLVFALHIGSDGKVTMAQWLTIANKTPGSDPLSHDEVDTLVSGSVFVKVTITDGDGDTKSETADISGKIGFRDDGPVAYNAEGLWTLDDENQAGGNSGGSGDSGAGTQLFGILNFTGGMDGLKGLEVQETVKALNDKGEQVPLKAIWIDADGVGHAVDVSVEWTGTIGGTLKGTATGLNGDTFDVFTLKVSASGGYTLDMHASLAHPFTSEKGTGSQIAWEDDLKLEFTYTVKDGDNDTDSATLTVKIDDDAPRLTGNTVSASLSEGAITGTGSETTVLTSHFDGLNRDKPNLGPNLSVNEGTFIVFHVPGASTLQGPGGQQPIIFTAATGTTFTIDQLAIGLNGALNPHLAHANRITLIGYDADGKPIATVTFDAASVGAATMTPSSIFAAAGTVFAGLQLSELKIVPPVGFGGFVILDDLVGTTTVGQPITPAETTIKLSDMAAFGADGQNKDGGFQFRQVSATQLAGVTSGGKPITIETIDGRLVGHTGDAKNPVFTVEISGGQAVFKLYHALDHTAGNPVSLDLGQHILAIDGDGDAVALGSVTVSIQPPPPPVVTLPTGDVTVAEAGLSDGSGNGSAATGERTIGFAMKNAPVEVKLGTHVLSDKPQTFPEETVNGVKGQLTAWYEYNAATGKGTIHSSFTLTDNTNGDNVQAGFPVVIKDVAGQQNQSAEFVVKVIDDAPLAPLAENTLPALVVSEASLATDPGKDAANFFKAFVFGADGAKATDYTLTLNGTNVATKLYALDPTKTDGKGGEILLTEENGAILGKVDGTVYFKITLENGEVKLDQQKAMWHGGDTNEAASLKLPDGTLTLSVKITDGDDDSKTGSADLGNGVFTFQDSAPTQNAPVGASLKEGDIKVLPDVLPPATTFDFQNVSGLITSLGTQLNAENLSGTGVYGTAYSGKNQSITITAKSNDTPFLLQQLNIGLIGNNQHLNVKLYGYDANGKIIAAQNITAGITALGVSPGTLFKATTTGIDGYPGFDGKEIAKLVIESPKQGFQLQIDNLVVGIGHITPGTITPAETVLDLSNAVSFGADGQQHADSGFKLVAVPAGALGSVKSGGSQVNIERNGDTLIGYTGTNKTDPVFTFKIENGQAVFKLYHALDHAAGVPVKIDFGPYIQAVDGDGDVTSLQNVIVTVQAAGSVTPVLLDLDHDGVETIDLSHSNVAFDYDGDGDAGRTAWVGPHDGILAIDLNGDGKVSGGAEIVFTQHVAGAATDLAALAALFDTDGDGKLTAADHDFARFGVWQDANSNGVSDPGEFKSLNELDIVGIDLHGNGPTAVSADGSVVTFGESTFTMLDGTTGTVADIGFGNLDTAASGTTFIIDPAALVDGDHVAEILADYDIGRGDVVDLTELLGSNVSAEHPGDFVRTVESGDGAADQLQVSATGNVDDFVTVAVLDANSGVKILYNDDQGHSQNTTV